jgi:hypothetical protein
MSANIEVAGLRRNPGIGARVRPAVVAAAIAILLAVTFVVARITAPGAAELTPPKARVAQIQVAPPVTGISWGTDCTGIAVRSAC